MASFQRLTALALTLLMLVLTPLQFSHHHTEDHHGHDYVLHKDGHHCAICDCLHHPSPGLLNDQLSFDLGQGEFTPDRACTILSTYHSHISEADASRGPPALA